MNALQLVTAHPTARWTAQQIVEAFPWDTVPRYLLRDRDGIYGSSFGDRVQRYSAGGAVAEHSQVMQNDGSGKYQDVFFKESLKTFVLDFGPRLRPGPLDRRAVRTLARA